MRRSDDRKTCNRLLPLTLAASLALVGCSGTKKNKVSYVTPYAPGTTLAVAPMVNLSGNADIDMIKVTDLMFSELQQFDDVTVLPVNRVLAEMAKSGSMSITTPEQAVALAQRLGADVLFGGAITEATPYYPPIVGIAIQVFPAQPTGAATVSIDPVALQRLATPIQFVADQDQRFLPKNQFTRIFNSRDKRIVDEVKDFAKERGTANSPFEWDVYLRSQEYYLRFVCHQSLAGIFASEKQRLAGNGLSDRQEYH